ncbi:hypothetical protein ACVBEH_15400 [Roseateles sp. GG27B]
MSERQDETKLIVHRNIEKLVTKITPKLGGFGLKLFQSVSRHCICSGLGAVCNRVVRFEVAHPKSGRTADFAPHQSPKKQNLPYGKTLVDASFVRKRKMPTAAWIVASMVVICVHLRHLRMCS